MEKIEFHKYMTDSSLGGIEAFKQKYKINKDLEIVDSDFFKENTYKSTFPENKKAVTVRALKLHETMMQRLWHESTSKKGPYKDICYLVVSHAIMVK